PSSPSLPAQRVARPGEPGEALHASSPLVACDCMAKAGYSGSPSESRLNQSFPGIDMADQSASAPLTYWDYIKLDELLSLQKPLTDAHDEMQFIMVHQTFELWFNLAINELRGALNALATHNLQLGAN